MQYLSRSLLVLLACSPLSACALDGGAPPLDDVASQTSALEAQAATVTAVRTFAGGVHGLAVGQHDRLYLSNSFGRPIPRLVYYLDPPYTGAFVPTTIASSIPAGLMAHGSHLFVCDVGSGTVREFDKKERLIRQWSASAPWNITRMPDGALLTVSFFGEVQRLDKKTEAGVTLFEGLDAPFGIAAAGDGTVWVSEQGATAPGAVTRRTLTGEIVESIAYEWNNPEGLLVDHDGNLWIAETGRGEILRYRHGQLEVVGQGLGLPVVLTQGGGDDDEDGDDSQPILANSANGPARLYSIDPGQ